MNEKAFESCSNLKEFVEYFKLSDSHCNIDFEGRVQIKTKNNNFNDKARVRITFDNFGSVYVIHEDVDATEYPVQFEAKWQFFEFIDETYLKTSGKHPNPQIGEYILKISI